MDKRWTVVIIVLAVLALVSFALSALITSFVNMGSSSIAEPSVRLGKGNIALISIKGAIMPSDGFNIVTPGVSSDSIIRDIEKADRDPNVKALLLEINSPGGAAVASQEVADAVKAVDKFKVAWIRETGASGAYWVASAADRIVASPLSITGSIGVLASYLDFSGFLVDHNVTYQRIVGGQYKDIGSPMKSLTDEERAILQESIDEMHRFFVKEVAINRNLPLDYVEGIATGAFYTGTKAKELGLIDVLGSRKEAVKIVEDELNIKSNLIVYKEKLTFLDALTSMASDVSYKMGQGIGSVFLDKGNIKIVT